MLEGIKTIILGISVCLVVSSLSEIEAKEVSRNPESELETKKPEDSLLQAEQCKCTNGYCEKNKYGREVCKCPTEWGLDPSGDKCTKCNCGLNANCNFSKRVLGQVSKTCICPKGYYLDSTCKSCNCGKDFNCKFNFWGEKTCLCDKGYSQSGDACVGTCSSNPCKNRGKCAKKGKDIECQCVAPFSGEFCEEKVAVSTAKATTFNFGSTTYSSSSTLKEFPSTPEPNPSTAASSTVHEKMTSVAATESTTRLTTTSPTLELIKSLVVKILIYEKKL